MKNIYRFSLITFICCLFFLELNAQNNFFIPNASTACGASQTLVIPIRVNNLTNVGSMQFTLQFGNGFTYVSHSSVSPAFASGGFPPGFAYFAGSNQLTFSWARQGGGLTIVGDTTIFTVTLNYAGGAPSTVGFLLNGPLQFEVTDPTTNPVSFTQTGGTVSSADVVNPTLTCPTSTSVMSNGPVTVPGLNATNISDNCGVTSSGFVVSAPTSANGTGTSVAAVNFVPGISTVTYSVSDAANNTATCSFTVNVMSNNQSDTLTLIAAPSVLTCGQSSYYVDILVNAFDSIGSLQYTLEWNEAIFRFDSFAMQLPILNLTPANFNLSQTSAGLFGFSWTTLNPSQPYLNLADGTRLLRLHFTVLTAGNINSPLSFTSIPVPIEAYNNAIPPGYEVPVLTQGTVVTSTDVLPPALTCPPSQTLTVQQNQTSIAVTGLTASATDNCDLTPSFTYQIVSNGNTGPVQTGASANGNYSVGSHTIAFTVTDDAGNTNICFTNVQVNAANPVVFYIDSTEVGCSGNTYADVSVRVRNFPDVVGAQFVVTWDETILDFDTIVYLAPGILSQPFNFGNFNSTSNGILQFADGIVTGWPNIPNDSIFFTMRFNVPSGTFSAPVNFISIPGFGFEVYDMNANQLNAIAINGLVASSDTIPPVFTSCPANVTVNTPALECNVFFSWPQVTASDNCGTVALDSNMTTRVFGTGNHLVLYTATDNAGNIDTCSFNVFVVDAIFPQFIIPCPANIIVNAGTNCSAAATWTAPTAFDACDQLAVPTVSAFSPGQTFAAGVTVVTYSATDQSGNTTSCSFTVSVIENVPPVVTCPTDIDIMLSGSDCSAQVNWPSVTATDNCSSNLTPVSQNAPGIYPTGFTVITYTATDASGNTGTCSFVVTITEQLAPSIQCPANVTANVDNSQPGQCGGIVTWPAATATDNCPGTITVIPTTQPGSFMPAGLTTVTYTATDPSGNSDTCSFTVSVVDTVPPVLICPPAQVVTLAPDSCDAVVTWQEPTLATIIEDCGIATFFTVGNFASPDTLGVGNYAITYIAIDNAGNFGQCVFNCMVRDTVLPVLSGCPNDSIVTTTACSVPFNFTLPTGTDNCDNNVVVNVAPANGTVLPVGSTTTFIVVGTDNYQNRDTCEFTVQVTGSQGPTITCPQNITQIGCTWVANWSQPTIIGFCDLPVSLTVAPFDTGSVIPSGIHFIQYSATGAAGSTATCSFTVTVSDPIPPIIVCPQNITVDVSGGITSDQSNFITNAVPGTNCANVLLSFGAPTTNDNCGNVILVQTSGPTSGAPFSAGVSSMSFLASDASGNTAACSFTITVDTISSIVSLVATPNPACPGEPLVITAPTIAGATYVWSGPGSNYPNAPVITIDPVTQAATGFYGVTITNNGCVFTGGTGVGVTVATQPIANNDFFPFLVGQSDTINPLANDTDLGTGVTVNLINAPIGITQLTGGQLLFNGALTAGDLVFQYEICSDVCDNNCSTATITLNIKESLCNFVPNIITPNEDGLNDEWVIPCLEFDAYPDNSVVIYNQWGDKVYEASPYVPFPKTTAWSGDLNGDKSKPLPDGVYYYIFKPTPTAAPLKGFVEIFR
jgi:large repetitive protein